MTDDGGPWGRQTPPPQRPKPRRPEPPRLAAILAVLLALAVLVFALARAFPEAVRTVDDWSSVAYAAGLAALLSAGLWRARGAGLARHLRHAAIWTAIAALLALAFAYRHELAQVPRRLQMAARPGAPMLTAEHELTVPQDDLGGYVILGEVNGRPVRFLVDTGATDTVLSPDDAARLGLDPGALTYDQRAETANGPGYGAPYVAQTLQVGPIALTDFPMTINQTPMTTSLLGLSFLHRLDGFEVRGRTLVMRWGEGPG